MTLFRFRFLPFVAAVMVSTGVAFAQVGDNEDSTVAKAPPTPGELGEAVDGLGDRLNLVENDLSVLKSLKISGYIQSEWQHYDQRSSLGGGALYSNSAKNLFTIRRGRLKFKYTSGIMDFVLQSDFTERGFEIKDAYAEIRALPNDMLTINTGIFNRPNYEVEYSSSAREAAERSQVVLAFYPKERDLGFMLTHKHEIVSGFAPKLQLGLFNGAGATFTETDAFKDFIGRLTFGLPLGDDSPVQVDLGASYYLGGIPQTTDTILKVSGDTTFTKFGDPINGSTFKGMGNRSNFNIESQIYLDVLPFGGTIIKGEFLSGQRPTPGNAAVASSVAIGKDASGKDSVVVKAGTAATLMQVRNQMGYYVYFIQNFSTDLQLVARYDFFDRNTNLAGDRVKSFSDAASSVLGIGLNWFVDKLRVTLWYEMPTFATGENLQTDSKGTILTDLRTVDVKDNKTTLRIQYKF